MSSEIQLFILWDKARNKENEIINEIKNSFSILEIYEICWSKENFKLNLERFYCEKIRQKIKHTGTGKFLLVTVRDNNPQYRYEETLKGFEYVNSKVLDLKKKLRTIASKGGGEKKCYAIHSTNDIAEADKNLILLLGKSYKEYEQYVNNKQFDGNYISINKDPNGTNSWGNLDEIFKVLNSSCNYVVLRGLDDKDGDIDILADDFKKVQYLLNAQKVHRQPYRCQVRTTVADKEVLFDIRSIGDNYYCEKWEDDILKNRVYDERGYFVPSKQDLFYSLIYHSLFHKKVLSDKYNKTLKTLSNEINIANVESYDNPYDLYTLLLKNFLEENDYFVSKPIDKKVKYNTNNISKMHWLALLQNKYGFKNINTFNGNKKCTSGFEYFFVADYLNKKVFIKCGTGTIYAKKEFELYNYLNKQNNNYFPKGIMYRHLNDNKMFLCIDYIDGETFKNFNFDEASTDKLNKIFKSLIDISELLFKNKFIHRDINPDNLIIENDGTVKLIDFQHLIGTTTYRCYKEETENIIFPKKLRGTNKKLRPFPFVWDDMYSIYNLLKVFENKGIMDYDSEVTKVKKRIGKQTYYFFNNKFTIKSYFNFKLLIFYKMFNSIFKLIRKIKK